MDQSGKIVAWLLAALCCVPATGGALAAESNLRDQLFGEVREVRAAAEDANAALLSPTTYLESVQDLQRAQEDFEKDKNLEKIKARIAEAESGFRRAMENAELARITLRDAIKSRTDANAADAFRLAPGDWTEAEEQFHDAARALERGRLKAAQSDGARADEAYRLAELNAIKALHLSEARVAIDEAERADVDRYAPRTLNRAKGLLAKAVAGLEADRYAPEEPAALAGEASYEARHAMQIAATVRQARDGDLSLEELILNVERPLEEAGRAAGVQADFSAGYERAGQQIIDRVGKLKERNSNLEKAVDERNQMIAGLEDELHDLDNRLGGATAERARLVRRLEDQARVREQFAQVEGMFDPDEAIVLRDGDKLIIRLVGLRFASGSAKLRAESRDLMDKVEDAVNVFPRSDLIVEGHTDTYGGARQNMALSLNRAQSVVDFMVDKMRIPGYRIQAQGYGDTRPIANNETAEGRAKNRRIDLIIIPENATAGS